MVNLDRIFDLNIEQVLEHWGLEHALREIIANALDEKKITDTQEIKIFKDLTGNWHIRDYGRGLQYIHFTQNENLEKLIAENLIGKFGVGLKDALAVFNRHGVVVEVNSRYANITLSVENKKGFEVETLHAVFNDPIDNSMIGTEFIFSGINDDHVEKAKGMFLNFNNLELLEKTSYGEVYRKDNHIDSSIFINGVKVATEENFMFSYNITNISAQIKKALNRERTNVGRTAYSSSVKKILMNCNESAVLELLVNDLENITRGSNKDEIGWVDVATYAAKTLNKQSDNTVFLTPEERNNLSNQDVEILENSKKKIIFVPENVKEKARGTITSFSHVVQDYQDSFQYKFISYEQLSVKEKSIFDTKDIVLNFLKRHNYSYEIPILVSETIRKHELGIDTRGVYEDGKIIIKRDALNKDEFLGVLIHEFAHHISKASDNTREFESQLTNFLGLAMGEIGEDYAINRKVSSVAKEAKMYRRKKKGIMSLFKRDLK